MTNTIKGEFLLIFFTFLDDQAFLMSAYLMDKGHQGKQKTPFDLDQRVDMDNTMDWYACRALPSLVAC